MRTVNACAERAAKRLAHWGIARTILASIAFVGLAAHAQPVLKLASALPANNPMMVNIYDGWVKSVNDAAAGEFQIQVMPPPFATTTNAWERTVNGVADMAIIILPNTGQPFAKASVSLLPMIGDDTLAGAVALWRMYEKGLIADEFKDVKLINLTTVPANVLISKDPVTKLEDLKGVKVRALDKNSSDAVTALGAAPLAVPFSEAYQALSRGVVGAALANSQTITGFKFGEVTKYQVPNVSFGMVPSAMVMNKDAYARLSAKGKAIIDRFTGEQSSRTIGSGHARMDAELQKEMRANKERTFNELAPAELARWRSMMEPVIADWVKRTPDGARVLETFRSEYQSVHGK